jgi:hypothetical protein
MKYILPLLVLLTACSEPVKKELPLPTKSEIAKEKKEVAINTFVDKGKISISSIMKDPSSTQFRNLKIYNQSQMMGVTSYLTSLCGEINAKNSYGAYGGYEYFYYTEYTEGIVVDEQTGKMYQKKCNLSDPSIGEIIDIAP